MDAAVFVTQPSSFVGLSTFHRWLSWFRAALRPGSAGDHTPVEEAFRAANPATVFGLPGTSGSFWRRTAVRQTSLVVRIAHSDRFILIV